MKPIIATMENGGGLIEGTAEAQSVRGKCTWRHPETCKFCKVKVCQVDNNKQSE